ncbi:Fur family transcriptional regulator [Anthocerotibacter panamensis]|uniref:Fur family transcriptional regulator n=1 Tax=Anthocerotibacter panamensis TaxID=2857077 RepID=UPI001C4043BA|nr:Fur family transcriptional regulator [Anthocerotibacter panamensis]
MVQTHPRDNFEAVLERCKLLGMRLSPQRRAILDLLCHTDNHLSAGAIYQQLIQMGQPVGYSSVYQNLEALARREFIEVLKDPQGNRYGWRPDPHHHFHCTQCGMIHDIDLPDPTNLFKIQPSVKGQVQRCSVDLFGTCERCLEANNR